MEESTSQEKAKKKKKHRKHAKKAEDVCIPIVSYPPEEDESAVEGPVQGPACGPPLSMIGPSLMENKLAETLKFSCGDPSESEVASSAAPASTSVVSSTSELSCVVSKDMKSTTASSTDERGENDVHKLKAVHEKYVKRSSKSRNSAADQLTNGKTSPVVANADNNKSAAVVGDTVAADDDGEYDEDDEFALKMLEEPVFLRYEFVNKKYDVAQEPDVPDMDVDLGPDDIDKELERALEQKTSTDFESGIGKRKADDDVSSNAVAKKIKTNLESATSIALLQQPVKDDVRRRVDELSEVADLASTVMDKLEFLEVSCASLSKLQVLLLQIETRIEDWRAGALRTDRLLTKLRESCATLRQYEMSATPPGWSCHWHRSYKRYYYRHDVTDQIRWDYPDVEVAVEPEKIQSSDRLDFVDTYPTENSTNACENLPSVEISSSVTIPSSAHVSYAGGSGGGNVPTVSVDSSAAFYPADDPPPPGTEPALPVRLPSDLLSSLAACPPPPPPVTPPDASVANMEDGGNVELEDVVGQINSSTLQSSLIHGLEDTNEVVISALPIRNKLAATEVTSSTYSLNTPVLSPAAEGDSEGPGSPFKDTADAGMIDGVPMGDVISSHSVSSQPGKERKKKKDKALVSGGLALKKKNVSSLVEKWQKVQQDVTDEITKEEQKLKMKKLAASTSSSHD